MPQHAVGDLQGVAEAPEQVGLVGLELEQVVGGLWTVIDLVRHPAYAPVVLAHERPRGLDRRLGALEHLVLTALGRVRIEQQHQVVQGWHGGAR